MDLARTLASCRERVAPAPASDTPGLVLVACTATSEAVDVRGLASLEHGIPMAPTTPVYAASLAKVVTALCVHRLAAQGRLAPDDDVVRWLPRLTGAAGITVRDLLEHRSGLPEYHALRLLAGHDVDDRLDADAVLDLAEAMVPTFPAGTRQTYTNTNYALLAAVVAAVTATPFVEAATELVLAPAGMNGAVLRPTADALVPGAATGHVRRGDQYLRSVMGAASMGDGGMWWTGRDLAALGRLLLGDGFPGPPAPDDAVARLRGQRPLPDGSLPALASGCIVDPAGWIGAVGEFVGFRAELRAYPDAGVAVGALANAQDAPVRALLDAVAEELGLPAPVARALPAPEPGPVPDGVLVGTGGGPWRFTAVGARAGDGGSGGAADAGDVVCRVEVGGLRFGLRTEGDGWRVVEQPSVVAGWESGALVVRDGPVELGRLAPVGGAPAPPDAIAALAGWWWCPAARAVLAVELDGSALRLRRGQRPPEPLEPIGERDGRWVLAAPWGLVELDRAGATGRVVLARAEGLGLLRLVPAPGGAP